MRAEGLLTKEAVIGVMCPQAKDTREWQQRPEAREKAWSAVSLTTSRRSQPCSHVADASILDF